MNKHEVSRETLTLAAAGALDAEELQRVRQHAETCEACQRELEVWDSYARGLRELAQPEAPWGLAQRTRARVLEQHASGDAAVIGAAVFAGIANVASWLVLREATGSVLVWPAIWNLVAWTTAGAAGVLLRAGRNSRRTL
jgi:anti-sigma factor RsiW